MKPEFGKGKTIVEKLAIEVPKAIIASTAKKFFEDVEDFRQLMNKGGQK